jgi:hypothetical protein
MTPRRCQLPTREAFGHHELEKGAKYDGPEHGRAEQPAYEAGRGEIAGADASCGEQEPRPDHENERTAWRGFAYGHGPRRL